MKFLEAFFSLNKILFPLCGSISMGTIMVLLFYILGKQLTDGLLIVFVGFGFFIGNLIKIIVLEKENKENNSDIV